MESTSAIGDAPRRTKNALIRIGPAVVIAVLPLLIVSLTFPQTARRPKRAFDAIRNAPVEHIGQPMMNGKRLPGLNPSID